MALALSTAALLGGCGGSPEIVRSTPAPEYPSQWPVVQPSDPASANAVLMRAISLVGTPYLYGGNTPQTGFDCSGLVNYVYRDMLDLRLPRTSRELAAIQGPRLAPERLAPADLVFFGDRGNVSHVGIYVGEGRFIHAPRSGAAVRVEDMRVTYWHKRFDGARRGPWPSRARAGALRSDSWREPAQAQAPAPAAALAAAPDAAPPRAPLR